MWLSKHDKWDTVPYIKIVFETKASNSAQDQKLLVRAYKLTTTDG